MKGSEPRCSVSGPNQTCAARAPTTAGSVEWSIPLIATSGSVRETCRRSIPLPSTRVTSVIAGAWRRSLRASNLCRSSRPSSQGSWTVQSNSARNSVEKGLNFVGRRIRFGAQARTQIGALIAVAEPRIAGAIDDKGNSDRDEQNQEIFLEQRSTWPRKRGGRNVVLHSITSSARSWVASGTVRPRLWAVLRLTEK